METGSRRLRHQPRNPLILLMSETLLVRCELTAAEVSGLWLAEIGELNGESLRSRISWF
jgi:hypothetical protein